METSLTKKEFDLWIIKFEKENKENKTDILLGRAFSLKYLKHSNNQLCNLQCDYEAIRYILNNYVDYNLIGKIEQHK